MTRRPTLRHRRHRGFSLIELMISLVIGLVVIGAVLAAYLASGVSSRNTQALAQVTEDANVALNVLRSHLSMVGYSRPIGVSGGGAFTPAYPGLGLMGCDTNFTSFAVDIGLLVCPAAAANDPDSIAIAYEVDPFNSATATVGSEKVPLDCVATKLAKEGSSPYQYYRSYSRFYLAVPSGATNKSLYCYGSGDGGTPQALVENIQDLQITYGVAAAAVSGENRRVSYYAKAVDVPSGGFANVVAIRVCVVVASANEVMDDITPYQPCSPFDPKVRPTDKRLYRAFTTTVALQNRLGPLL